ncbi:Asp/Glu racemase [Rhodobacteraceae bacterium NNCM2]|nr:Asp/Glu racemase [Coraliihabitans acroporae]
MTAGSRGRARIGVLVPFTNTNLEPDMVMLAPEGVSVHFARLGGYDADEIPDDKQMAGLGAADLGEPLALIQGVRPDVILYGCTSATLTHGSAFDRALAAQIRERSGAASVTAAGALVHAIRALGATHIAFASPYVGAINDQAVAFLASEGVETVGRTDIGRDLGNYGQGELQPDEIHALACRADVPEAEAIVLSCTDMRSVETVARLEADLGKPVICSNQAMMFQALELIGLAPTVPCGRLLGRCAA